MTGEQSPGRIWAVGSVGAQASQEEFGRVRVRVDGKQFALGQERFRFTGVTYGTFRPREDGARFPDTRRMKLDFELMAQYGIGVVRTYTSPPEDLLEAAADFDLRVLAGVFYPDWRYLLGAGRREARRLVGQARAEVAAQARRLAPSDQVLGLCIGNEVPADVIRWYGAAHLTAAIDELVSCVRDIDPDLLVTYANYPTAEYLQLPSLDFLTFNVFLEQPAALRRYLTRLQHLAGDRPLVLGELGLHAGGPEDPAGEARQAESIDWQLATAVERGVAGVCLFSWTDEWHVGTEDVAGWHFGLTRADRSLRPALEVVGRWSRAGVRDLHGAQDWLGLSVVVCAYNAAATLDECLGHCSRLDYPNLEVIVVDDGSADNTAEIAESWSARDPRIRLLSIEHGGLSVARNTGAAVAAKDVVAYLDSDAYPTQEWPYYLVLGLDSANVAGVGGPNLAPPGDGLGAARVARAPGGPVHVLLADDRAEHVPGCNMAFYRHVIEEVGGFDPVYTAAGDDVDFCWRVLDRGYEIGFHPAALVWHHRRGSLRAYLRQQRGYGRAESLVANRHPDRFTSLGSARWRGRIYDSLTPTVSRRRIYRGLYGAAAYQSLYGGNGHLVDVAHQAGVPAAVASLLLLALWPWVPALALVPVAFAAGLLGLAVYDAVAAQPPRGMR
ncbi:MAG: glycosyltransferase family 2 protein, partial [Mycobacteriales bacterium]